MAQLTEALTYVRRAAWHLRTGGRHQLRAFRTRQRIVAGADARPTITKVSPLARLFTRNAAHTLTLDFPEAQPVKNTPLYADYTVATIFDDFSAAAWSHEFTTLAPTPDNWKEIFTQHTIDFLFVESAWAGNGGSWRYHLTGANAPSEEFRALVAYCKEHRIPTVFWNKEDPPHFEDFLPTAALFDAVFTSDTTKISDYTQRLGHTNIDVLPFAASTAIHNPARPPHGFHERDVAFAGMYFAHKYPERRQQMNLLLGAAHAASQGMENGLEIFSRFLGNDENYQFPTPFDQCVVGSLPYSKMLTAYKAYKVFLNVNSVTQSPSMCARRVFEITASGTPVVTTRSEAIPRFFTQDQVPVVDTAEQAQQTIEALVRSPELNARTTHLAQRTIWQKHTYSHRAERVLAAAGKAPKNLRTALPETTVMVSTHRPEQLTHVLETVAGFEDVPVQLALLTHGFELPVAETRAAARDLGIDNLLLLSQPATASLGECLNILVDAADGAVLTKVDDDDRYGKKYLADMLYALRYSGAQVVGKQAHYMHLESSGATILRNPEREHRYTHFVMGPTLTGAREVFAAHPFESVSIGEDTAFLQSVTAAGGLIYSADRFNFTQVRTSNAHQHSWAVDDAQLLASAEVQFYGRGTSHIML